MSVHPLPIQADRTWLNPHQLTERARSLYRSGGMPRGDSTGWPALDELYTVVPGQFTVVTGVPSSGKSEWLDAMLVNLAERASWEFALYSPENWPPETHLVKLCEKRARKPFGDGPNPRMSEAEFDRAAAWVHQRFFWMEPDLKTPDHLVQTALAGGDHGSRFGVVLDPWNTLDHQRGGMSETDYVSMVLTDVVKLCREAMAHVWLVVHPTKLFRNKDGTRPIPGPYDISGSAHWYNKADNIVTIHRDQASGSQITEVHVQKVRFKHIGRVGLAELRYDKVTGRYFPLGPGLRDEQYADPERGQPPPMFDAERAAIVGEGA